MKFKDKNNEELIRQYNEIRFNPNVVGEGKLVTTKSAQEGKRLFGSATILSLMTISGYYDEAVKNDDMSSFDIANKMFENASKKIGEYPENQELRGRI